MGQITGLQQAHFVRSARRIERPISQKAVFCMVQSFARTCHASTEICIMASMKTTLDLNDQLLADAKALAAQERTSLTRLIEEGLKLRMRAQSEPAKRSRVRLPVFKGRGGLVVGVNPLSNKALLAALGDDA